MCIRDSRTSIEETFFEVPDNLRHKVTIRLKAEFHNMLSQYTYKTPLDVIFTTAEVYGRPLTLGHFVSTYQPPSLIGGFKTYTYSPYLIVEDNDNDPSNNHIIQGKSYQEFFSSLIPMANSTLTRLTLEMEVDDPGKEPEVRSRDLLDRVGYAARHGTAKPKPVDTQKPAIMEFEQTTLFITPGLISWGGVEPLQEALRNLSEQANVLASKVDAVMEKGSELGIEEFIIGMPHRGRLKCSIYSLYTSRNQSGLCHPPAYNRHRWSRPQHRGHPDSAHTVWAGKSC